MDAIEQLAALAGRQIERSRSDRDRNRATFSAGAELMDMFRSMTPRVTYAENFDTGERVGKPDTNTYIENFLDLLDRARELPRVMAGGGRI